MLIVRSTFTLNLLLKVEITNVTPVNHKHDARVTPEINVIELAAGSVT